MCTSIWIHLCAQLGVLHQASESLHVSPPTYVLLQWTRVWIDHNVKDEQKADSCVKRRVSLTAGSLWKKKKPLPWDVVGHHCVSRIFKAPLMPHDFTSGPAGSTAGLNNPEVVSSSNRDCVSASGQVDLWLISSLARERADVIDFTMINSKTRESEGGDWTWAVIPEFRQVSAFLNNWSAPDRKQGFLRILMLQSFLSRTHVNITQHMSVFKKWFALVELWLLLAERL